MSVTKVWNHGQIIWQDYVQVDYLEQPILVHVDNADIIVLEQNGQSIVVHPQIINEFCRVLKTYKPKKQVGVISE